MKHFFSLQGKAPKEIHGILTETFACFLPGRTKDLSASRHLGLHITTLAVREATDEISNAYHKSLKRC